MGFYTFKGKRKCATRGSVRGGKFFLNDSEVTQAEFDAAFPAKEVAGGYETLPAHQSACWPQVMESLAVHPTQVDAANARAKRHGIDATYQAGTGVVAVGSRADRARLIRLDGCHDKGGGYSDG